MTTNQTAPMFKENREKRFAFNVKYGVFWPPFLLLLVAVIFSFVNLEEYMRIASQMNDWILSTFSWLFSLSSFCLLISLIAAYFSPLGKIRLGGAAAKPLLTKWQWFSITLCTTVATGILFWGTAEPMFHLYQPPESLGIVPQSTEAIQFTMATMFMHWSITPYAIYCLPALVFALAYYNFQLPFSIGTALSPIFGRWVQGSKGQVIDAIALFALVAGMASSLGTGVLVLSGGVESVFGLPNDKTVMAIIAIAIVITFIASAVSGLQKGIARLSNINAQVFILCCAFVFMFGPTQYILSIGLDGIIDYFSHFFARSFNTYTGPEDNWPKLWTVFYWANWYAWAPITALFLGRIAKGYTVRQFIIVNAVLPATAAIVWMATFAGTAMHLDNITQGSLHQVMQEKGVEAVIFTLFDNLPLAAMTTAIFIAITFISYVTAADSNTDAMSNLCAAEPSETELNSKENNRNIENQSAKSKMLLKFVWGISIGVIAWVMVSFASIDGIKMMSNLGGLPAMFIIIGTNIVLFKLIYHAYKGKTFEPVKINN
ncbi:BCCT family transporter [Aliiglaciecola sp. SL4]|uniref:BCCT family transporter n=1 Tax=Aliiglaciecola sp. SL4 TaxID=3239806 RepID=UPI00355B3CC7